LRTCLSFQDEHEMKKQKAPGKSSSSKYKKRQRKQTRNRILKERRIAEFEFAQRIQKEPGLADLQRKYQR